MTRPALRLGISTCPNDTFAFHSLLTGSITLPSADLQIELMDVQELNEGLLRGDFDVAKGSFHAALHLSDRYGVLPSGAALGFGVGPLLLASGEGSNPATGRFAGGGEGSPQPRILCPGRWTTATLLYRLFYPQIGEMQQVLFSEIIPALQRGDADFGVCIHEGRFTYHEYGLSCVEDLGTRWEQETGQPLPLGGILCRLDLDPTLIEEIQAAIARSLKFSLSHPQETLGTMRRYAQEFSDEVLFSHVQLYVNRWTEELGSQGTGALRTLHQRAREAGVVPAAQPPLKFLPESLFRSDKNRDPLTVESPSP